MILSIQVLSKKITGKKKKKTSIPRLFWTGRFGHFNNPFPLTNLAGSANSYLY